MPLQPPSSSAAFLLSGRSCTLPIPHSPPLPTAIHLSSALSLTQSSLWPSEGNPADPTSSSTPLPPSWTFLRPPLKCIFSHIGVSWGFTPHQCPSLISWDVVSLLRSRPSNILKQQPASQRINTFAAHIDFSQQSNICGPCVMCCVINANVFARETVFRKEMKCARSLVLCKWCEMRVHICDGLCACACFGSPTLSETNTDDYVYLDV